VRLHIEALEDRTLFSSWTLLPTNVPNYPNVHFGPMIQLSDGTVMVQEGNTSSQWFKLTPDLFGNYVNGTWSQLASMQVARQYYGSNVLPSGKLLVVGGEYSSAGGDTNTGEIFDPTANSGHGSWSLITPFPQSNFGDDPTQMLDPTQTFPNRRILAGYLGGPQTYFYDPVANSWSFAANKLRGDSSDEETWTKLPDGSILSYDVWASVSQNTFLAERYIPSQNQWVDASNVDPHNPPGLLSSASSGYELGPAVLLPDQRVFFLGANGSTGNTAFYTPSTSTWTAGPPIPDGCTASDVPGALLPNGDVLLYAWNGTRDYFFEFNPTTNTYADRTPTNFSRPVASHCYMVVLPTGQILLSNDQNKQLDVYTPDGSPDNSWRPNVTDIYQQGNGVVSLVGTQLNGISQGALWGDDNEAFSNYPLVQLLGIPFLGNPYVRTSNWSSTGVAEEDTPESVLFQLGSRTDVLLHVIGDGIASPTVLNVEMSPSVDNVTLRRDPSNPADLEVLNNGAFFDDVPFSSFSSIIVTGAVNTSNDLTVDYSSGGFFSTPVTFDGGAGFIPSNTLTVTDAADSHTRSWTLGGFGDFGQGIIAYNTGLLTNPLVSYSGVQTVTLDSGSGGGDVDVRTTPSAVTTNVVAGGRTTVRIGFFGNSQFIGGPVNIENPPNYTTINIDDSADPSARTTTLGTYTPAGDTPWGYISGLTPADIHYEYEDTSSLTIRTGTASGNVIRVWEDGVPTNLISNATANVTIGDGLVGAQDILGTLSIENPPSYTTVWIDDTADPSARTTTLGTYTPAGDTPWGYISGLVPADIDYEYADTASLTINGSQASGNVIRVWEDGVPTNLNSNAPATINVGDGLVGVQSILGTLNINNPLSPTALNVDDSADHASHPNVVLSSGSLTGLAPAAINFGSASVASLTLTGGQGGNTFDLSAGTSATAVVTLTGGGGSNTLIGSNAGNSWEVTGADTGVLSGSAYPNPVAFNQVGNLAAGSGGDYFLFDDQATLSGSLAGGGSDTLDYTPYSTSVIVDLRTGFATGVGGLVSGIGTVLGGTGNGSLGAYNLLIGDYGVNVLQGGFGRRNLLVAGPSASTLIGGDQDDLLIGGWTVYDTQAGLGSWLQIASYWAGTDPFATRVSNLLSGIGVPPLDNTTPTVMGNNVADESGNNLIGTGELALLYTDGLDSVGPPPGPPPGFDPASVMILIIP
jgi:hypothetical protein